MDGWDGYKIRGLMKTGERKEGGRWTERQSCSLKVTGTDQIVWRDTFFGGKSVHTSELTPFGIYREHLRLFNNAKYEGGVLGIVVFVGLKENYIFSLVVRKIKE